MKFEELGIDPKTRAHTAVPLTREENIFVAILWADHVGERHAIGAERLAVLFHCDREELERPDDPEARIRNMMRYDRSRRELGQWTRDVRHMANHLILQHARIPLLSKAGTGGGYYIASCQDEADRFYQAFRKRATTGFTKAARGRANEMVTMIEQLPLAFEEVQDPAGIVDASAAERPADRLQAKIVDRFLERMAAEPDRFAADLARIRKRFGTVLFSREQAAAIERHAEEIRRLLGGISV